MSRIIIYPYKMSSKSDQRVQAAIEERTDADCIRVYPDRNYHPQRGDTIVGWGSGEWPNWRDEAIRLGNQVKWLNTPDKISLAVDKITSFNFFGRANVAIPPVTRRLEEARAWLSEGHRVVARTLTEGRDGEGAVIMNRPNDLINAPLYSLFVNKQSEYRVHVFNGQCVGVQQRVQRDGEEIRNQDLRTSSNGWGLTRNFNVPVNQDVIDNGVKAVNSLGLYFGCADVGVDRFRGAMVFEVNTAPELFEAGASVYARHILAAAR